MKEQILALYDEGCGLSAEEIAGELKLEPAVVDAVLRQYSSLYRASVSGGAVNDIDDATYQQALNSLRDLNLGAESEFARLSAAKEIIAIRKGYKDPKATQINFNGNTILAFNEKMKRIKAARQTAATIEIPAESSS